MMGWTCPGCGACYSPSVAQCAVCQPRFCTYTTTGTACAHDFDLSSTLPTCRKCGALRAVTPPVWIGTALALLVVAPWLAACSAGPQMPVITIPVNVSCTWTSGGGSVADAAPGGDMADNDCLVDHVSPATSTDTTGNDNRGARVDAQVRTDVSATGTP